MEHAFEVVLNDFLSQLGVKNYSINEQGCELRFDNNLHLSIIPSEDSSAILLLIEVEKITLEFQMQISLLMLEANLLWQGSDGFTFAFDNENSTAILQYALPLMNLSSQELYDTVEKLVETASFWKEQFMKIQSEETTLVTTETLI